jgi:hypothetical protein
LIQCLLQALMRWRIGSQTALIPMEGNMHEIVALGIGHLVKVGPYQTLDPMTHYPVYLCEPLVVLYLSSVLDKHLFTTKEKWIADAFLLVFEGPVHATGKKPKPNRTELRFGCFAVAVALIYSSHRLRLH